MTKTAIVTGGAGGIGKAIAPGPVEGEMARVHPPDQVADYLTSTLRDVRDLARPADWPTAWTTLPGPAATSLRPTC